MLGVSTWSFDSGALAPETVALIDRMTTPPSAQRLSLIDAVQRGLTDTGIRDKLDALWITAASDSQAAGLNWISSNYTLSPVNSPTFTADVGYTCNGTSNYVDTTYNMLTNGVNFQRNSASFGFWSTRQASTGPDAYGRFDGTSGTVIRSRSSSSFFICRTNCASPSIDIANSDGRGLYAGDRSGASAQKSFKNGALAGSNTTASSAVLNDTIRLGNAQVGQFSPASAAMMFIGGSLTDAQHQALYDITVPYLTAVGAI